MSTGIEGISNAVNKLMEVVNVVSQEELIDRALLTSLIALLITKNIITKDDLEAFSVIGQSQEDKVFSDAFDKRIMSIKRVARI